MIQVNASISINGKSKSCSFKSDNNREITEKDMDRIYKFSLANINYNNIVISYRIDYNIIDGNHGVAIGATYISSSKKLDEAIRHIIKQLNIKSKELNLEVFSNE